MPDLAGMGSLQFSLFTMLVQDNISMGVSAIFTLTAKPQEA